MAQTSQACSNTRPCMLCKLSRQSCLDICQRRIECIQLTYQSEPQYQQHTRSDARCLWVHRTQGPCPCTATHRPDWYRFRMCLRNSSAEPRHPRGSSCRAHTACMLSHRQHPDTYPQDTFGRSPAREDRCTSQQAMVAFIGRLSNSVDQQVDAVMAGLGMDSPHSDEAESFEAFPGGVRYGPGYALMSMKKFFKRPRRSYDVTVGGYTVRVDVAKSASLSAVPRHPSLVAGIRCEHPR